MSSVPSVTVASRLLRPSRSVRVIAGALKGRRLKAPSWDGLRPTSDKLRETLFNILATRIAGARFLDGYAGTGAVGIEALSRGCKSVTFVERDRRAETLIEENLKHCGVDSGYAIIREPIARAIDQLDAAAFGPHELFDLIWLDPPYDEQPDAVLAAAAALIAPGGLLVLEHARRRVAPEAAGRLARVRQVTSGDSMLSFYELKN